MPDDQLNQFLTSTDIDKNKILKHMQSIPPEYIAQVLEQITGEPAQNLNSIDLTKQIGQLNPLEYQDALMAFQPTQNSSWFYLLEKSTKNGSSYSIITLTQLL